MLRGIDASSVQGALPCKQLAADGIRFAILKAQQGNDGFDPWFERNMRSCFDHGIEPFAYCFFYPLPITTPDGVTNPTRDPKHQAKLFVDKVHRWEEMRCRPIFLDYEWPPVVDTRPGKKGWKEWGCTPQVIADSMRENAAEVHRLSGAKPIIYTYDDWWSSIRDGRAAYGYPKGADVSWASEYPLWMAWYPYQRKGVAARWPAPPERPKVPAPWKDWLFWQFDGNGGLLLPNGVDADFCVFHGTVDELRALAYQPRPEVTPPPFDGPIVHANEEMLEAEIARYRERRRAVL